MFSYSAKTFSLNEEGSRVIKGRTFLDNALIVYRGGLWNLFKNLKERCIVRMIQTLFKEKLNDLFSEIFEKWELILCCLPQMTSKRHGLAQRKEDGSFGVWCT